MIIVTKRRSVAFRLLTIGTLFAFMWTFLLPHEAMARQRVKISEGTAVVLRTNTTLTPEQLKVGDAVELSAVYDVVVNGKVVIKEGARARGEIVTSQERRMIGMAAKIVLAVRSVQAVDETTVPLSGSKFVEGKDRMCMSIGLSLLCCILFALMRGGDAFIPSGTQIECTVAGTTEVTVQ